MGIWGGWMGPKSENVGFSLVLPLLFEGSRGPWGRQPCKKPSEKYRFGVQKVIFLIKDALQLHLELCFLCGWGAQFQKIHESKWSESEKWSQHNDGYMKIPPTWGRIHEDVIKIMSDTSLKSPKAATCIKNTYVCEVFWGRACGPGGWQEGKRTNNRATGPKHITKTGPIWPVSTAKSWDLSLKVLCVYS